MDATGIATQFAPAPTSTDNHTVALWLIGVLVLVVGYLFRLLWNKQEADAIRCRDEAKASQAAIAEAHEKIQDLHAGAIAETLKVTIETKATLERVTDVVERNNRIVEEAARTISKAGTGVHPTLQRG